MSGLKRDTGLYLLVILFSALASWAAIAATGKTADGCTYKIINGKYLTSCPSEDNEEEAPAKASAEAPNAPATPSVTDYGDVPMRKHDSAKAPKLPPMQPGKAAREERAIERSSYSKENYEEPETDFASRVYLGLGLGATNNISAKAGSTTGLGVNVGMDLDDIFGIELGYSYAKQSLRLGLENRNGGSSSYFLGSDDSSLSSHLLTGELQAHLSDPSHSFRPYIGGGLGWRSSNLEEKSYGYVSGNSLHQSSLGGLGSLGTTFRVNHNVQVGVSFRYFFPIFRQTAELKNSFSSNLPSRLKTTDDSLTGSSQSQIFAGVRYWF